MRSNHRFAAGVALALALFLAVAGCGGSRAPAPAGPTPAAGAPAATFRYYATANPTTFDPAMVTDVSTMTAVIANVYSGLVYFNPAGEVVPDLAERWEISPDGRTYTFFLRDAKFHSGRPVTAADFRFSLLRAMNPQLRSPVADSYLDDIAGYARFLKQQAAINQAVQDQKLDQAGADRELAAAYAELQRDPGITVRDDRTLVIQIDQPRAYFLAKLTYPTAWLVDRTVVRDNEPIAPTPENVGQATGTGPFRLDRYDDKSRLVLKRFDGFYGDKAKVGTVELSIIEKDAPALAAYRSGQIDVVAVPPSEYRAVRAGAEARELVEWPTARINYIAMNQAKVQAFRDPRVRQAFNHAIDKQKMVDVVFEGTHFPASGVLPDSIPGALGARVQALKFDPARARALLQEAGYGQGGRPFPPIKLTYRAPNETTQKWAEFVQNQLQANLGIRVDLEPMEWGKMLQETQNKHSLDMFLLGWSADYMDPQNFLSLLLHSRATYNRYGYANPEFDAIVEQADVAAPGPARLAEYGRAEQVAVTDAAWVPATYPKSIRLVKPYVKGFVYSAMGEMRYNQIEIAR